MFHQDVRGAVQTQVRHRQEVNVDQLTQGAVLLQPVPGRQFRPRLAHSADQVAQDRCLHHPFDAQVVQRLDQTQLACRMQTDVFDAHRPGLRHLQRVHIDFLEVRRRARFAGRSGATLRR
jgi:hypothetical protein